VARIDDLVTHISDPDLQGQFVEAIEELKRQKRFGLVFEEHIPETTALTGLPVTVGSVVQDRTATPARQGDSYEVIAIDAGVVTLKPVGSARKKKPCDIADLLVVKRFGEPIYPALTRVGERTERRVTAGST
jgi:adenine-specific DNA-methyltransferase